MQRAIPFAYWTFVLFVDFKCDHVNYMHFPPTISSGLHSFMPTTWNSRREKGKCQRLTISMPKEYKTEHEEVVQRKCTRQLLALYLQQGFSVFQGISKFFDNSLLREIWSSIFMYFVCYRCALLSCVHICRMSIQFRFGTPFKAYDASKKTRIFSYRVFGLLHAHNKHTHTLNMRTHGNWLFVFLLHYRTVFIEMSRAYGVRYSYKNAFTKRNYKATYN